MPAEMPGCIAPTAHARVNLGFYLHNQWDALSSCHVRQRRCQRVLRADDESRAGVNVKVTAGQGRSANRGNDA